MSGILLTGWDLQESTNATAHKTSDFITKQLVLRRGWSFNVSCTLSRDLQPGERLSFVVEIGSSPSEAKKTCVVMPISSSGSKTSWSATSVSHTGSTIITSINIPATAIIGLYHLSLQATSGGRTSKRSFGDIYVLFNPWSAEDEVYMEKESERQEYVLNETGVIFIGSVDSFRGKAWDFGQFAYAILDTTLAMLDKSTDAKKDPVADLLKRNSALHVSRVLSSMVNNCNNNNGVLVDNWSGHYENGVSPSRWNGSVPILHQWHKKGPVSYGQCWVFAGVLCTVLRCLGIPCRVITNFMSAHDHNRDLLIDLYFDPKGNKLDSKESVWNFHAWNECWMKRGDLGSFYNGWQILDATPQELSKGLYRLGPCSLKAVHEGDVDLDYDTHFVFAEVNGDYVHWIKYADGSKTKAYTDFKRIGQLTSTKAVGCMSREDVTLNYKYSEGSAKERQIFNKAWLKMSKTSALNPAPGPARRDASGCENLEEAAPKPDFTGIFKPTGHPQVGEDLCFILHLKNNAAEGRDIKANMTATAIIYTSTTVKSISAKEQTVSLAPNEEKQISYPVTYLEYKDAITKDNMVQVVAVCVDDQGKQLLTDTVATLKNPTLHLQISGNPVVNQPLTVNVVFSNPFAKDVTNGHLVVGGSGLLNNPLSMELPHLKPNETSTTQFEFTPYKAGQRLLVVHFSSDSVNADAHELITISPA